MSEKTELKPCPFCGSERVRYEVTSLGDEHKFFGYVVCHDCGAASQYESANNAEQTQRAKSITAEAWNRRASDPKPDAQIPGSDEMTELYHKWGRIKELEAKLAAIKAVME